MTTHTDSFSQDWDAIDLLEIINPDKLSVSCVGYAPSQGRRCRNPIAQHNFEAAKRLLRELPRLAENESVLRQQLHEIASLTLCRSYHQYQAASVSDRWHRIVVAEVNRRNHAGSYFSTTDTDAIMEEIRRLQREMDDLLRRQQFWYRQPAGEGNQHQYQRRTADASDSQNNEQARERQQARQRAEERQREEQHRRTEERRQADEQRRHEEEQRREGERREEARRQAERERSEREAEARRRAEQERERREQEEAARRRREQQARQQAERERREWSDSWDRYERDWANMSRIDTFTLDEDVRDSLPWPVKDGTWREVTDYGVEDFFKHAPDGVFENSRRLRSLLRRQALHWHEDKIRQFFPRIASDPEVLRLTGLVMQVINKLTERL